MVEKFKRPRQKTEMIQMKVKLELKQKVQEMAREQGITMTEFMEKAAQELIESLKTK